MKVKRTIAALLSTALLLTAAALPAAAAEKCPVRVNYALGATGVSDELTAEAVKIGDNPRHVPKVEAMEGYTFQGWTTQDPAKLKAGEEPKLVEPEKTAVEKDTVFYAVYRKTDTVAAMEHEHYVIGYPDGTFGPGDAITRGSVATIIARACLDGFQEGGNYGNPGNYSDAAENWAYSAISYCTMKDVFKGYDDGTFRPNQPITRQEFATVIARLAGMKQDQGTPFTDAADIAAWAKDGVYTTYVSGWVNGYTDGTFKPLDNIRRDEAVKIFNGYLHRGVDQAGLEGMTAFVYQGDGQHAAHDSSKNDQYMVWPDVPAGHWAYYEIIEAANDHTFVYPVKDLTPPEQWSEAFIQEVWLYHDQADG